MEDCVFCRIAAGEIPGLKVYEDEETAAIMDIAKDVDGHILILPKRHCKNILDCAPDTLDAVMRTAQLVSRHLTEKCGYTGVNLLNASDESAGQSVPHFHIHVIPRRPGDRIDAWPRFDGAKQDIRAVFEQIRIRDPQSAGSVNA